MQVLLHFTTIFIVLSFFAFVAFDFTVNIIALWNRCKPQSNAPQPQPQIESQVQVEPQLQIEPQVQQEQLPDIWEESQERVVERPIQAASMIFQLMLPPAKEVVTVVTPAKKRGRPSKKSVVTSLPTVEAELASTFCQPEQIAVAPAKKRGRPKKVA